MTSLKVGIVEDDLLIAESIFITLQQLGYNPIRPVRSYFEAVLMVRTEAPDFLLIDIRLDGTEDGIDLAHLVNKEFQIPFIFLTANSDNATVTRAKEVNPGAFLVKPFNESDLFSSIEIAFNNFNLTRKAKPEVKKMKDFVFIKERDIFHKINLDDIQFVESDNVYLNIITAERTYVIRNKLENFISAYAHQNFIRVHRRYAINVRHLESIKFMSVIIAAKEIPINKNYKQELLAMVNALK